MSIQKLTAYFDESGFEGSSPWIVVAGYVGKEEQWARFNEDWQALLDKYRLPFFHMTDFENRQKQFRALVNDQRKHLLNSALSYMRIRTLKAFVGCVLRSDYNEVIPLELVKEIGGPYHAR